MHKHEEKKVLDKKFDVLNVINKTYADSSEYDLNDTLIYLSKVITQTKVKNKDLVKTNFSKFVECRIVLEEILDDMKMKKLDKDFSSEIFNNINYVKSKFKPLNIQDDLNRERKLMIINKYKKLFNIKTLLEGNLKKYERFVEIYKEGKSQFDEIKNSRFAQKLWESIKDTKIEFLEKLYKDILDDRKDFLEILYIFELYFQVSESKTDRKIMNTLLVNFKEKCLDINVTNKDNYLKEVNYFFLKTIIHLDRELQKELIIFLFNKIKIVFSKSNYDFINIWLFKYKSFLPDFIDLDVKGVYDVNYLSLKKEIIDNLLDRTNLYETYNKLHGLLDKEDYYLLNHKLISMIESTSKTLKLESSEDIEKYFTELDRFDKFLENEIDEYKELKRNILKTSLREKIKDVGSFMRNNQNKPKKMMEILRIIDKLPDYYEIVLKGILPALENDKCILYFLTKFLKIDAPILNGQQEVEVQTLMPQFGFLINKT